MEKQKNAYQSWLVFTIYLVLSALRIMNRSLMREIFDTWITPYSIPLVSLAITLLIRWSVKVGNWLSSGLQKMHIPAWILFLVTVIVYFWWGDQIS
jgi:SNF family Na+-dependent transporter